MQGKFNYVLTLSANLLGRINENKKRPTEKILDIFHQGIFPADEYDGIPYMFLVSFRFESY